MMKIKFIIVFIVMFVCVIFIFPKNLIIGDKKVYINEISGWPDLVEYLKSYKRIKNYMISENPSNNDLVLEIKIININFSVTDFENDMGSVAIDEKGVILQKKKEQTIRFNYTVEINIIKNVNSPNKKVDLTDSMNIWFTTKKTFNVESGALNRYDLYTYKKGSEIDEKEINREFNRYNMIQYKDQLLLDISKKIASRLITEL